jgi:hypothetical protein
MKTLELSDEAYARAMDLARRCEWTVERVIAQALEDADDLQCDIDLCDARRLNTLAAIPDPA